MKLRTLLLILFCMPVFLAGCGWNSTPAATETSAPTATPDLCSPENLPGEAARVNKLMREFDDYSALASNTPQSQLIIVIPEMQRILRDTEDLAVPACMQNLKNLQIGHMNLVVQTLMAFMNNTDVNLINAGIAQARELHGQYDVELARLLGITLAPQPTAPAQPSVTQDANATSIPVAQVPSVTNPGPNGVNLRSAPGLNAPESGVLDALASTTAFGKSADDQWIQVEIPGQPGQTAWVYAQLVQLSVPITDLPVVNQ